MDSINFVTALVSPPRDPLLEEVPGEAEAVQAVCDCVPRRQRGVQGPLHNGRLQCGVLVVDPLRWQYGASRARAPGAASEGAACPIPALLSSVWHDRRIDTGRPFGGRWGWTAAGAAAGHVDRAGHHNALESVVDEWRWRAVIVAKAWVYRRRLLGVYMQLILLPFTCYQMCECVLVGVIGEVCCSFSFVIDLWGWWMDGRVGEWVGMNGQRVWEGG